MPHLLPTSPRIADLTTVTTSLLNLKSFTACLQSVSKQWTRQIPQKSPLKSNNNKKRDFAFFLLLFIFLYKSVNAKILSKLTRKFQKSIDKIPFVMYNIKVVYLGIVIITKLLHFSLLLNMRVWRNTMVRSTSWQALACYQGLPWCADAKDSGSSEVTCYKNFQILICGYGGIGRRARFRF